MNIPKSDQEDINPSRRTVLAHSAGSIPIINGLGNGLTGMSVNRESTTESNSTNFVQNKDPAWTQFRGGRERTGRASIQDPPEPDRIRWSIGVGTTEAYPLVVDDRVFVGDDAGNILALDINDGSLLWQTALDSQTTLAPAYSDGIIVATTKSGHVYVIDSITGKIRWKQRFAGKPTAPLIDKNKNIFIGAAVSKSGWEQRIYSFSIAKKELNWFTKHDSRFNIDDFPLIKYPVPALAGNSVVANFSITFEWENGASTDVIAGFDTSSGDLQWANAPGATWRYVAAPAIDGTSGYAVEEEAGLVRFSTINGGVSWNKSVNDHGDLATIPTVGAERVIATEFVDFQTPAYTAVEKQTGNEQWRYIANNRGSHPTIAGDQVYIVDSGTLKSLAPDNGFPDWSFDITEGGKTNGIVGSGPIPTSSGFIVQYEGTLYALGDGSVEAASDSSSKTTTDQDGGTDTASPQSDGTVKNQETKSDKKKATGSTTESSLVEGSTRSSDSSGSRRTWFGGISDAMLTITSITITVISTIVSVIQLNRGGD